jgi:YbgC/YbaW family acyl-CoA thioester hydrolase
MPAYTHRVRVSFIDTDASGRIHFTAMLRYFEAAEQEFIRSLGFNYRDAPKDMGFPRVRVECEYRAALIFDDVVDIVVSVRRVGTSSYTLAFDAVKDGVLTANGSLVVVCANRSQGRSQDLPGTLRDALRNAVGPAS